MTKSLNTKKPKNLKKCLRKKTGEDTEGFSSEANRVNKK